MIKRYLITFIFVCTICVVFSQPVCQHGQLRVEGANIVDQNGQKVALKGISLSWHNWWPQFYNSSVVEYLSHNWHISVIRAAMGVEVSGGYLDSPEKSEALIKTVIDAAIANGVYVIVDWHSHDIYTEQAESFFSGIAQQYTGYPNMIYEIFNEPESKPWKEIKWKEIKEYSVSVIESIRKYDKHNLIIVGNSTCSQDVDIVADDPIDGYENIVYSLHFYAASHEDVRDKAEYAVKKGLPLFVSECSPSEADGDGKLDKKKFSRWLKFLERNNISFVMWGIYDKEESSAMLKPGADQDGNWPRSELTEMGIYSRYIMKGRNALTDIVLIIGSLFVIVIVYALIRKKFIK